MRVNLLGAYFIGKDPTYFPVVLKFLRTKKFNPNDFDDFEFKKLNDLITYLQLPMATSRRIPSWNPSQRKGNLSLQNGDSAVLASWNGSHDVNAVLGIEALSRFTVKVGKTLGCFSAMYVGLITMEDFHHHQRNIPERGWSVCFFNKVGNIRSSMNTNCRPFAAECVLNVVYKANRGEIIFKAKSAQGHLLLECSFQNVPSKPYMPFVACDPSLGDRTSGAPPELLRFC